MNQKELILNINRAYLDWELEDDSDDYTAGMSFGQFVMVRLDPKINQTRQLLARAETVGESLLTLFAFDRLGHGENLMDRCTRIGSNSAWGSDRRHELHEILKQVAAMRTALSEMPGRAVGTRARTGIARRPAQSAAV